MNVTQLLKDAQNAPDKRGLKACLDVIWELKRKDYSLREIADFLKERGVQTDHVAIYRLLARENPLLNHEHGWVLIGDVEYEYRKGCPLRPFGAGLSVHILRRKQIVPLKTHKHVSSTWCEAQFELNSVPNYAWLEKLCQQLGLVWNPDEPTHLQGPTNFSLKFEGSVAALVCHEFNLEKQLTDFVIAIRETNEFFTTDKKWLERLNKARAERKAAILEEIIVPPGMSEDEECADFLEWNRKAAKSLEERFEKIPIQ